MIRKIVYDHSVDLLKAKFDANKLLNILSELANDENVYTLGIDFANKKSLDKSVMSVLEYDNGKYALTRFVELSN
jgi:ribosomal protein L25 (general stress protein Ctc)